MPKVEYDDPRYSLVFENDNVSKTNDIKEFFKLVLITGLVLLVLHFVINFCIVIFITSLSQEQQVGFENFLSSFSSSKKLKFAPPFNEDKLNKLNTMTIKIQSKDKNLNQSKVFEFYQIDDNKINAFVSPDGKIYFTKGLLEKVNSESELTFVLAHEIAHYANKDHLKAFSRNIAMAFCISLANLDPSATKGLIDVSATQYSQSQEINADKYASNMVTAIYGNNQDVIRFLEKLKQEDNLPEPLYLFATHPAPQKRIRLLQN